MDLFVFLVLLLIVFINFIIYRKLYHPAMIFTFFWLFIFLLYSFHLYGLNYMSMEAYKLFLIGIIFFSIGCLIGNKLYVKKKYNYTYNYKKLRIIFWIAFFIFLISICNNILLIYQGNTVSQIRYSNEFRNTYIMTVLIMFYAVPVSIAMFAIFIAHLIEKKNNKEITFYAFTLLFMEILSQFETMGIYLFVGGMIFLIVYLYSNGLIEQQMKRRLKKAFIIICIVIILLSQLRDMSLLKHIYVYFTGSLVCFSEKLNDFVLLGRDSFIGQYTYGIASVQGFIRPFAGGLEMLGIDLDLFNSASDFYWPFLAVPISIGNTAEINSFNYFSTPFLYFYKDLGMFGVYFLSILYGFICSKCFVRFVRYKGVYYASILVFIIFSIFMTLMEAPFTRQSFALAIFIIYITRKRV